MPISDSRSNLLTTRINKLIADDKKMEAVHAVAQYDGKEAIPVLVKILKQVNAVNGQEIEASFKALTNVELETILKTSTKKENFSAALFSATMGKTIREYFEVIIGSGLTPSPRSYSLKDIDQKLIDTRMDDIFKRFIDSKPIHKIITSEIQKNKPNEFNVLMQKLKNQIIIDFLIEVYSDSDRKQNVSDENQTSEFAEFAVYKERLRKPFIILVLACNRLNVSTETQSLWHQAAIWLSGLHLRVYKLMCELYPSIVNENGEVFVKDEKYPTIDAEDEKFNGSLGCTKMWMSKRHEEISDRIDVLVKELNKEIKAKHQDFKTKKPFVFTVNEEEIKVVLSEAAQAAQPLKSPAAKSGKLDVAYVEKDGMIELTIRAPKDKSKEMMAIREGAKSILEKPVLNVKEWSDKLARSITEHTWHDIDTKVRKLQTLISKFSLPLELSGLRKSILDEASLCPLEYANSVSFWSFSGAFKTSFYFFRGQANASDANNLYQELAQFNTPAEQINRLIEIRLDLKLKNSKGLLSVIENILSKVFDDILTGKVLADEEVEQRKNNVTAFPSFADLPLAQQQFLLAQAQQQLLASQIPVSIQPALQSASIKKK